MTWKSPGWCSGGSADSDVGDMWGIACSARGVVEVGETLWIPFIRIFGLDDIVAEVAVEAISLAKEAEVVVTGGGRRWPW
jgi:hypothetical protein